MKTKTALKVLSVAALVGTFATQASALELKMGHNGKPGSLFEASANEFAKAANAKLGDKAKVTVFGSGQLGKDNEVIQQVRDGITESCISSAGGVAQHYPLVGVFDIPFAFPNIAVASKVIDKGSSFGKKFVGDLEAKTGLKVLGLIDSGGFFAFTNSKRPIASVADMKGLRIRTMTLPTHEAIISSLGGQPTPLPWAEVYTALQTGVADGQMNPIPIITSVNFDEVQKFLSVSNHVITPDRKSVV